MSAFPGAISRLERLANRWSAKYSAGALKNQRKTARILACC
jgi:hypothetical protein